MNREQQKAFIAKIEAAWHSRAAAQELDPKTMKYKRAELEFVMGVITTLNVLDETPRAPDTLSTDVPVVWIINAMAGHSCFEPRKEKTA